MLAALLEFYNTDGEYFKFGDVVLDIGLEDILYITGLPIDGKQVYIYIYIYIFLFFFYFISFLSLNRN
jgi:hypothetical protein